MRDDLLYLITDRHACGADRLVVRVRQALEGGVRLVQLRERDLSDAELLRLAQPMRKICGEFEARLIVNRRLSVALAAGADGLHVGADQIPLLGDLRAIAQRPILIGVSTHSVAEAEAAERAGADFVTLGPVYETPSKAGMGEPLGPTEVGRGVKACRIPVFGLGGVSVDRLDEMKRAGIGRISVIRAVLAAADPAQAAADLLARLRS
ncbi:MAG: thiamine phosphate synthase [Myxococcales bacterium]|nr:MAG: thiamine phosphate synthase [Myxococcales bacterium]